MQIRFYVVLFFVLLSGMALPASSFSQDIIIKKNGDEIKSKILEVSSSDIKYKKSDNMEGPTYSLPKSDVFMIKYENGTKEIISSLNVPSATPSKKETAGEKKFFREQKSYVSFGYGFGTFIQLSNEGLFSGSYPHYFNNNGSLTGPVYAKYEYALSEDLSIGINIAYIEYKYNEDFIYYPTPYTLTYTFTSFSGLLRANWHFGNSEKIDPYYGLGLGYRSGKWKTAGNSPYGSNENYSGYLPFGFETTLGIRVKFSEHLGAYTEAGIAKSAVQFGMVIKF